MTETWKYTGPIFDAHSHIGNIEDIDKLVEIGNSLGISHQIGIVHTKEGFDAAKEELLKWKEKKTERSIEGL